MHVHHKTHVPIHVIGYGSSGTSIFCQMLREKLGVGIGTESQFILRFYCELHRYGDLADDRNLRRLIEVICCERWFERNQKFGFSTTPEAILAGVRERTYRGVLEAVFDQLAKHLDAERWGDKTPEYVLDLPTLWRLFPDAQYIHVVRDGRDVAHSVMARYWGPKNIYTAAREWASQVSLVTEFLETVPADQKMEVRYEDFLADPIPIFERLIDFLKVDDADGKVLDRIRNTVPGELNRTNSGKWKTSWSQNQRLAFERVACDVLKHYRYETLLDQAAASPGLLARAYWRVDNRLRKLTWRDYWLDNAYKMRLRLAERLQRFRNKASRAQ